MRPPDANTQRTSQDRQDPEFPRLVFPLLWWHAQQALRKWPALREFLPREIY